MATAIYPRRQSLCCGAHSLARSQAATHLPARALPYQNEAPKRRCGRQPSLSCNEALSSKRICSTIHHASALRRADSSVGALRATGEAVEGTADTKLPDPQPVRKAEGGLASFPQSPGVYTVYDKGGTLQYVGMSRKVATSIANHVADLPELTDAVAVTPVADASRESLTAAWTLAVQSAVTATGQVPPGNAKGVKTWTQRRNVAKAEVKLTPGKGLADLSVPLEEIIGQVVKQNKVVAFIKGTRTAPECGFSHQVLTLLNASRAAYEVVNVLDDVHNPGLRETLKTFSEWPTIPQLYVDGEFVGGADIIVEMAGKGELNALLTAK